MELIELLKAVFFGLVEGITEWLPISSTGHMILFDKFVTLNVSKQFLDMFLVVIQLGAIMAVIVLYFHKLNPFSPRKDSLEKRGTLMLWAKVLVACIPAAVIGLLFDSWVKDHYYTAVVVACALIIYGIAFIVVERVKRSANRAFYLHGRGRHFSSNPLEETDELNSLSFPKALCIGLFQCLAIIPGTSRSGSTILGALILGVTRKTAAEFSFFLAIPVMFGWSLLRVVKAFMVEHLVCTSTEWGVLVFGVLVSFMVSVLAIKLLMGFIKQHSFELFGWYRIGLGILVIVYFAVFGGLFDLAS